MRRCLLAAVVVALAGSVVPASAVAGSFAVMTYNVRGLPSPVIEDRTDQIAAIAPLLEDFHTPVGPYIGVNSIVGLQEVFSQDYYNVLTNPLTVTYPYFTDKDASGLAGYGDGLTLLSDFAVDQYSRTPWDNCVVDSMTLEGDCDATKGWSFGRVHLEANVVVDVYTLHTNAGQDDASRAARRANITQLVNAINTISAPENAVIVLGDTNSLYTRVGNDNLQDLLAGAGVNDAWVQLRRGGLVPAAGADIDADCATNPGSADCELVDKIFYRDGTQLVLAPQTYDALKQMFSDGMGAGLSDHVPVAVSFDYATMTTTTTTTVSTSTSTSTSTTTTTERPCGDPVALLYEIPPGRAATPAEAKAVVASDALFVLKAAVGSVVCAPCTCDVNDNGSITATDALRVLKKAVGQDIVLTCPLC